LTEKDSHIFFTLWDADAVPLNNSGLVYSWNGYAESDSLLSLLNYVETHSERLRKKYLAWIHGLGEGQINGKRLIDHLAFEDGLSYWWLTLFVEKSLWKSPAIVDALRLIALEEIIVQQKPRQFCLVSANRNLHKVISGLCKDLGIAYEWQRPRLHQWPHLSLRRLYLALPFFVQAIVTLIRYLFERWPLKNGGKSNWVGGDRSLFFCSYFLNFDSKLAEAGGFRSGYWEGLHSLIKKMGFSDNWLQLYYPHDAVPNPQSAIDKVNRFNQCSRGQSFHTFLDAYLSWQVVWCVLKRWLKLTFISFFRLRKIKNVFRSHDSKLSLWPIMRGEWEKSMRGSVAIHNLLSIELFDRALKAVPHQKKGLYLFENQAWERAFIHAWRKNGHGQLLAVQHATVRFWDLRYFTDRLTIQSLDPQPIPQADLTVLNGKAAVDVCVKADYSKETIVEGEALRFDYLNALHIGSFRKTRAGPIKVLILSDYVSAETIRMFKLLEIAVTQISDSVEFTVKPHPGYLVEAEDYPSLKLKIVRGALGEILHDFDIAFASNKTTAAVDAYLVGLPVVVAMDEMDLNLSPLRGQSGVQFVSMPEELALALQSVRQTMACKSACDDFFFLDPELPRWQKLLSSI